MKVKYFLFFILIFFFLAYSVQAVTIKVKPSEIKIKTEPGILERKIITVENPTNGVILYEVYLDYFTDWIEIKPESFTLESREKKKVILEVRNREEGIFSTMISVIAKPLSERKFRAVAGVKIPLEIHISAREEKPFFASLYRNLNPWLQGKSGIYIMGSIFGIIILLILIAEKQRKKSRA